MQLLCAFDTLERVEHRTWDHDTGHLGENGNSRRNQDHAKNAEGSDDAANFHLGSLQNDGATLDEGARIVHAVG